MPDYGLAVRNLLVKMTGGIMKQSILVFLLFLLTSNGFAQKEIEVTLINKTGFDFIKLYLSPADKNEWGENLYAGVLNNREAEALKLKIQKDSCMYDLKALRPDVSALIFKGLNLCMMPIITLIYEFGQPNFVQDFVLENHTGLTFSELYIRSTNTDAWGLNVLGLNVLTTDESAEISFKPSTRNCRYDFRAVLLNGTSMLYSNIDLCNQMHVVLARYEGTPYYWYDF
jgi:hypothetical protein